MIMDLSLTNLQKLPKESKVYLDHNRVNFKIYNEINDRCEIEKGVNITTRLKTIKNDTEIGNLRNCQIRDGVAMVNFLHWLDKNVNNKKNYRNKCCTKADGV